MFHKSYKHESIFLLNNISVFHFDSILRPIKIKTRTHREQKQFLWILVDMLFIRDRFESN